MKKFLIVIIIILFCIGCNNDKNNNVDTQKKISYEEAYDNINDLFKYNERPDDFEFSYYKEIQYEVMDKVDDYYCFLVYDKIQNYKYYVLMDVYGKGVISPIDIEKIE